MSDAIFMAFAAMAPASMSGMSISARAAADAKPPPEPEHAKKEVLGWRMQSRHLSLGTPTKGSRLEVKVSGFSVAKQPSR